MTLSLQPIKLYPPRILIYGEPKKGKSTFGYQAPNPVFIQTEDGLTSLPDASAFPLCQTWADFKKWAKELATEEHSFNTVVIDSLDWLESLIHKQVCEDKRVTSIGDLDWGAGYNVALKYWKEYLTIINYLREKKNMMIVQIAHSKVNKYKDPESDSYDIHAIKMHDKASDLIKERSDLIIFLATKIIIKRDEEAFNKVTKTALGGSERVLITGDKSSNHAGSRYGGMPQEIPFDKEGNYWNTIMSNIPFFNQKKVQKDV